MPSQRRPAKDPKLPATSLEEQERLLEERKRQIREEMAQCQEVVKRAPEIKQEQARIRREEIAKIRASQLPPAQRRRSALPDIRHHYQYQVAPQVQRGPRLRRERSQGRLTFFLLLAALLVVLAWAYTTLTPR